MIAVLALLVAVPTVLAATAPRAALLPRQSAISAGSDSTCDSACTPVENIDTTDSSTATLCTNTIVQDLATCYDCLVSVDELTADYAQEVMDGYVEDCAQSGFTVSNFTITGASTGDSGGSSGGGTTGGGDGSSGGGDAGGSTNITDSDPACLSACTPVENAVDAAGSSVAALCTNTIVQGYATCYDCLVSKGAEKADDAQETMDEYVADCAKHGFQVSSVTITGASTDGSSGGSSGTGTMAGTGSSGAGTTAGSGTGSGGSQNGTASTSTSTGTGSTSTGSTGGGNTSGASSRLQLGTEYVAGGVVLASTLSLLLMGSI